MIRGVNKNIIEISDTGNECFERAILFVRPDSERLDSNTLRERASQYVAGLRLRPWFFSRGRFLAALFKITLGAAAGAGITALVLLL